MNFKIEKCIVCNKNNVTYPWVCSECAENNRRKEKRARLSFGISFVFFIIIAALL
jgi:predicted nucleic acid-binding Zn ribbon protein